MQAVFHLIALILLHAHASLQDEPDIEGVAFAEVQSCQGCQLRGLPEVKSFIFEDVPLYGENVVFKKVQGAPPELILYDGENKELKRIALREYTRRGCNELMELYGFKKREKSEL
uniref:Selenoprotein M n=1 Tax=Lygus hesperus TaxID=30085 RepID=A0A0A9W4D2_LYGHE